MDEPNSGWRRGGTFGGFAKYQFILDHFDPNKGPTARRSGCDMNPRTHNETYLWGQLTHYNCLLLTIFLSAFSLFLAFWVLSD